MNALPFDVEATIDSMFEHARRKGLRGSHVRSPRIWFGGRLTIMTLGTAAQAMRRVSVVTRVGLGLTTASGRPRSALAQIAAAQTAG
jgi:hypothetical protein